MELKISITQDDTKKEPCVHPISLAVPEKMKIAIEQLRADRKDGSTPYDINKDARIFFETYLKQIGRL